MGGVGADGNVSAQKKPLREFLEAAFWFVAKATRTSQELLLLLLGDLLLRFLGYLLLGRLLGCLLSYLLGSLLLRSFLLGHSTVLRKAESEG